MQSLRLNLVRTVSSRSEAGGMLSVAGDAVLVERGRPRLLVLMCPCGCGEVFATNIDKQAGKAWRLYRNRGSVSLFPSVWRDTGCESHFIISRGKIYLFSRWGKEGDREEDELWADKDSIRRESVLNALSHVSLESVDVIADRLDENPWDVLNVCRHLVADGLAIEGIKAQRGHFRRA